MEVDQSNLTGLSEKGLLPQAYTAGKKIVNNAIDTTKQIIDDPKKFIDNKVKGTLPENVRNTVSDKNIPENVIKENRTSKNETVIFPEGLTQPGNVQNGPYVVIKAYKYTRKLEKKETTEPLYRIYLPMPPNVTQGYQAHMENFSGSTIADVIATKFGSESDVKTAMISGAGMVAGAVGLAALQNKIFDTIDKSRFGQAATNAYSSALSGDVRSQVSSIAGLSINPRYEVAFSSMGLRRHSFTFTLTPTSNTEAEAINKLVKQLRYSSHPSETLYDVLLSYPDKFIIEFRDSKGNLIEAMPHLPDCMIEGFEVNTVVGRMHGNDPVSTIINVAFVEQHTLTRSSTVINR